MTSIIIDGVNIPCGELVGVLRKNDQVKYIVKEIILEQELAEVKLDTNFEEELLNNFRKERSLESREAFSNYLSTSFLDEKLLREMVTRPDRIYKYREERWGSRAESLYLKNKDRYDMVCFRMVQYEDADIMQEVYFRLKDNEIDWTTLAKQFNPNNNVKDGLIGPVSVENISPVLLEALRKTGIGKVIRPLKIENQVVVAQLESFQPRQFDEELRQLIMRHEFETWLEEKCTKMMSKVTFQS